MKQLTLPSGATLKITLSPFAVSKNLYQAMLEELKTLDLDGNSDIDVNLYKDVFCSGFSSKKIETALAECMKRALYNDVRITDETFEPEQARQDYLTVLFEVAVANVSPFTKDLTAQLTRFVDQLKSRQ